VADSLARDERALLIAEDDAGHIVGTAQVVWAGPENQPHRADVAKMLVHRRARRLGAGAALLAAAEQAALAADRTLLVLDTASADAERLYERGGWQRVGTIPRYALLPDGPFCSTVLYYKDLKGRT
jgi:GNAT superfamily N-acetyltransferase